jgi:hypothetical protein
MVDCKIVVSHKFGKGMLQDLSSGELSASKQKRDTGARFEASDLNGITTSNIGHLILSNIYPSKSISKQNRRVIILDLISSGGYL